MAMGACLAALVAGGPVAVASANSDSGTTDERPSLVALGDSRAAGPFIDPLSHDDFCMRSEQNYGAVLARLISARSYTDVTCIAAKSENIVDTPQRIGTTVRAPQVEAQPRHRHRHDQHRRRRLESRRRHP
ncbi:hypothetical protein [Rhodococcus rhodnii]|uniref:hypothetical protein n=1 Tax=Rhodococcus rhodnii TaxID=38312 RepID=UPI000AF39DEB|nr:hypothetical protein [Rhodococcus rhodnii]